MSLFHTVVNKATDYFFRKRSPALVVFRAGICLVILSLTGTFALKANYVDSHQAFSVDILSSDASEELINIGFYAGIVLMILGLAWELFRYNIERSKQARQVIISMEQRGLVNTSDLSVSSFVQSINKGKRVEPIVIDIRDSLANGTISHPVPALQKFLAIENSIEERRNQRSVDDFEIAYGGLVPVPFAFLTGYLIDDESSVQVVDWDREASNWRLLDGYDDDASFSIERLCKDPPHNEVVVAVSFSYPVDTKGIEGAFPNLSQIHLKLDNQRFDNHWSKNKQARLSYEFIECVKTLLADGVEQIHLILACQNSVAFCFGQAYDRRNLPPITIYQYERSQVNRYPWGVHIPQSHTIAPKVVNNKIL